jgi:predicted component of type VI protein secretion system
VLDYLVLVESDDGSDQDESFHVDIGDDIPKLRLKIFGGPRSGEVFYSNGMDCDEIKIGRSPHCNVTIDDEVLSKYQCRIFYDFNTKTWVLEDGSHHKKSLNGTWLYLNEEYSVTDQMVFKAHQTLFQAKYTK